MLEVVFPQNSELILPGNIPYAERNIVAELDILEVEADCWNSWHAKVKFHLVGNCGLPCIVQTKQNYLELLFNLKKSPE